MNEEAVRCGQVIEDNNFKLGNYSTSAYKVISRLLTEPYEA